MITSGTLTRYRCPAKGVAGRQFAPWFQLLQMQRVGYGSARNDGEIGKKKKISSLLLETANSTLMKLTDDVQLGGVVSPVRVEQ